MAHAVLASSRSVTLRLKSLTAKLQLLANGRHASSAAGAAGAAGQSNPVVTQYKQAVVEGSISHDERQWALAQELGALYERICKYRAQMEEHHRRDAEYQAQRVTALQRMLAQELAEEQQRHPQAAGEGSRHPAGRARSWRSWAEQAARQHLGISLGRAQAAELTPKQRERLEALQREERVLQELGPPPAPPAPPQGLYIWGSVGSGKSMLMDMFFEAASSSAGLPHARRMHFNAAMLEVHSRLHQLDKERWERQHQQQAAAEMAATASSGSSGPAAPADQPQPQPGGKDVAAAAADGGDDGGDSGSEGDEALPVAAGQQGVLRYWDPEVARQKEAKAAFLAIRRHLRLTRLGRHNPRSLAAANASNLQRAAASFIRGRAGNVRSGWTGHGGPLACLLCFDEVQVTDVFSAVALKGLVEALTAGGCVVVATSNRAPHDLPRHGLHEAMWQHFIDTLTARCRVYELSSEADYRRLMLSNAAAPCKPPALAAASAAGSAVGVAEGSGAGGSAWPLVSGSYLHPLGPDNQRAMEEMWQRHVERAGGDSSSTELQVMFGRTLPVHRKAGGAAWFQFSELCAQPLGPADYIAVAHNFHTVFLASIPAMNLQVRDQARRFITLVDELYNARCLLVASAEVQPDQLFGGGQHGAAAEPILDLEGLQFETAVEQARLRRDSLAHGGVAPVAATPAALSAAMGLLGGLEEQFAFKRAVSRLHEMQSPQYMRTAVRLRQARSA